MSCLVALMIFMADRAGMPDYKQGWAIHDSDLKVYTWYSKPYDKKSDLVEYFVIAKKKENICNAIGSGCTENLLSKFEAVGTCDSRYTIFTLQRKIEK